MRQDIVRIDQEPSPVPSGGLHVDVQEEASAEIRRGNVERVVLDPSIHAQEEEPLFADKGSHEVGDPRRVVWMHHDVDVVSHSVGQVLVVPEDKPSDLGVV